jgi:hypothetical protein
MPKHVGAKKKSKVFIYRAEWTQRVVRGIALSFLDPGARRGCVVSTTPRPLDPRERPGTHYTGGWVIYELSYIINKLNE